MNDGWREKRCDRTQRTYTALYRSSKSFGHSSGLARYRLHRKTGFRECNVVLAHSDPKIRCQTICVMHVNRIGPANTAPPIQWYSVGAIRTGASACNEGKGVARTLQSILNKFRLSSMDNVLSRTSQEENRPIQMLSAGINIPRKRRHSMT